MATDAAHVRSHTTADKVTYSVYTLTSGSLGTTDRFKISGVGSSCGVKASYVSSSAVQPSYLDKDENAAFATDINTLDQTVSSGTRVDHDWVTLALAAGTDLYIQPSPAAGAGTLAAVIMIRQGGHN